MKEIPLTRGYVAFVDDEDYERVTAAGPWCVLINRPGCIYAQRRVRKPDGRRTFQYLHRFILGLTDPKVLVDHRNRYGLDNQRGNLRIASRSQNAGNGNKRKDGITSRFRGVFWRESHKMWCAQIQINHKRLHLGYFTDELNAARAYDAAARKYRGEFAKFNLGQKPTTKKG
jgi:hypothetical protein